MEAAQEPGCTAGLDRRNLSQKESLCSEMFPGCSQSSIIDDGQHRLSLGSARLLGNSAKTWEGDGLH